MTKKSKTILITGGLSDIGRAMAQSFARAGYAIALNYRQKPEQAQAFASSLIRDCGAPQAIACQGDIRLRKDITEMFDRICREFGGLDVLVNNAGINIDGAFLEMPDEDWETVITTILTGTFRCSQEFAQRYQGKEGNIINIGAVTALKGRKNGANYCSARAGVLTLTKCLALELAPNIRVNTVTPGLIDTRELRERYRLDDETKRKAHEQDIPLRKIGDPEDIAAMILFLVESGKYITGQNFFVDGGLCMR
jgi:3-oxoacyl-[acyl-carrier protein] reductase